MLVVPSVDPIVLWPQSITTSRKLQATCHTNTRLLICISTISRKNFTNVGNFIEEPDSRAQCVALEDNVKEFGLTYFGMTDRRQGIVHIIGPEQGFTVRIPVPSCQLSSDSLVSRLAPWHHDCLWRLSHIE